MNDDVVLALDFGGTKVEAALVTPAGALVADSRRRAATGRAATSEELESAVTAVALGALDAAAGRRVLGVGIGTAGPIERNAGLVSPLNVPAWRGYPMRELVERVVTDRIGAVPVRLEMDGVAIVLAEHWVGAAQGVDDVMGMVVSTGIGGGLILGGRVVVGETGNAGHVGHLAVAGMTGEDTFGWPYALEAIASGPHTVAWARHHGFEGTDGEALAAAYASGDPVARDAVRRCGEAVGQAICSATALVDLELVAIGGGFSRVTPEIFDVIRERIAEHYFPFVRKVRVVPSGLSDEGPLVGAAALVHRAEMVPGRRERPPRI